MKVKEGFIDIYSMPRRTSLLCDPGASIAHFDEIKSFKLQRRNSVFENLSDSQRKLFDVLDSLDFDIFEY